MNIQETENTSAPAGIAQVLVYLAVFASIILVCDLLFYFLSKNGFTVTPPVGLVIEIFVGWAVVLPSLTKRGFIRRTFFRWNYMAFTDALLTLIIGVSLSLTLLELMTWIPFDPPEALAVYNETASQNSLHPIILASLLIGPIAEETFFRGFVFYQWRSKYGFGKALVGSSLLFGFAHLLSWKIRIALPAGFLLAFLYQRLNNLLPVILGHIGINLAPRLTDSILRLFKYSPNELQHIPVKVINLSAIICVAGYVILHLYSGKQGRKMVNVFDI